MSLATFAANIPVIFVTLGCRRFEDDSVAKVMASLAVSDIVNGIIAGCCAGVAWSLQPGEQPPTWLLSVINSGMITFGMSSLCHLAAVSVVKCAVIVRPLTHFTIFTDRTLHTIVFTIWMLSLLVYGTSNVGVAEGYFNWITMTSYVNHQPLDIWAPFLSAVFVVTTLIITTAYIKVFMVVRRQVRSMPADVLGSFGSRTIFGSSVRAAKNLFVICVSYYITYLPTMSVLALKAIGILVPDAVHFTAEWIYRSSAAVNGFLYIALHSSFRRELRRYLPRCRRNNTVAPAAIQTVGDGDRQRHYGIVNTDAEAPEAPEAPATVMTSSCQRVTERLAITNL